MDENPYEAPKVPNDARSSSKGLALNSRSFTAFVALALLSIPASLIALFATCYVSYHGSKSGPGFTDAMVYGYYGGLTLGGCLGSAAMAVVLWCAVEHLRPNVRLAAFAICMILGVVGIVAVCVLFRFNPDLLPSFLF